MEGRKNYFPLKKLVRVDTIKDILLNLLDYVDAVNLGLAVGNSAKDTFLRKYKIYHYKRFQKIPATLPVAVEKYNDHQIIVTL